MNVVAKYGRKNLALSVVLLAGIALSVVRVATAVTPNPGHPWSEVGDGVFSVSGPSTMRVFAFPDANATVLTSNALVTAAQGGTNNGFTQFTGPASSTKTFTLPNASATILTDNALVTAAQGGTGNGFFAVTGPASTTKTFTFPNASATVLTSNAAVTIAQGGTGQTTQAAAFDALSPTTTRGDLVVRGVSASVRLAVGGNNTVLRSNGTDPLWGSVNLATDVTGVLPTANGGLDNGFFAVTGPASTTKTFTFPNASATVLTSNAAVTIAQGGTGQTTATAAFDALSPTTTRGDLVVQGVSAAGRLAVGGNNTVLRSNGTDPLWGSIGLTTDVTGILPAANGGTNNGFTQFTGPTTSTKTFTLPNSSATILTDNADITVAQGGTGLSTLTANNVILGNGTGTPNFVAPGASGNLLTSNGTTWTSVAPASDIAFMNLPYMATGAVSAVQSNSLTSRKVALFTVAATTTVNQLAYNVGTVNTAGSYRFCVYNDAGSTKLIDVTDTPAAGVNTITVSPAVTLQPGTYYLAFGCATTCNNTVTTFTTTAVPMINGASVPSGKRVYEGTVTHTSGTCNSTLGTITGGNSLAPVVRFDN